MKEVKPLSNYVEYCKNLAGDLTYSNAKKWKESSKKRIIIGTIPNYFPREIIHAAGGMAVGIISSAYQKPMLRNDTDRSRGACFMLNGINELALNENLNIFDGFIFPSLCEIIQNTTIAKISEKSKFIKYLDFPQYYHTVIGDIMNQNAVNDILKEMYRINKVKVNSDRLRASIQLYKRNLKLTELIYNLQKTYPERITFEDLYYLVYSGFVIPIEEHNAILENVLHLIQDDKSEEPDDFFNVFGEEIFF